MSRSRTWRCFHCGDLFRNPKHAASHFGLDQLQEPGCVAVLRHGESHLLDRIRDLELELRRYRDEDSDIMRWAQAKESEHRQALIREDERGYNKGVSDGRAYPPEGLDEVGEQGIAAGDEPLPTACNPRSRTDA